ncbi:hypothetical protein TrLO_g10621 [Triparma laevis f. longispina]|uniref:Rap-GAP domain-containing protein n=1 Tax=Triparma laevis f. longispina TaxID=1714387 RepID=A0A9W7CJC5_9STRA|nr:hypothetical protein TrLO_g10621 [Triparma laevis f. longispina]
MSTSSSNTLTSMGFTSSRSLDDPSVVSLQTDKRLTRFFSSDKSPRKKLRTAIEFCKSSEREERERFFGGYKDEVWKTVLSTVEQYEKLKMDEWSNEDQGSTGFMSKFGLKKNIGVPDWLDVFKIIDELFEHCAPSIAFNGWENNTILDLLQKLLHPQNMHSIRLPALKLLLNYTTTLSDHSESDDHINLLKASCLGGLESLIDMSSSKPGQPGQVFTPKSNITSTPQPPPSQSPYLKELKFTCWNNQPMECLKSENSLTLEDHLAMLAEVLKFSVSSRATEGKRHDSIGGQQDSNMTLLFCSNLLCTHIFPVLLPQALPTSSTQPYEVPEMSKNLQTAPYRVLQILEKWTDELVQEGGSALDIFWSDGNNGKIIYECFRQRLDHLSDPVRHEMALRTLKKYLTLVETTSSSTTSSAPKHILKASGDACVTFAGHVCSLLIDPSDILSSEKFEEIIHLCVGLFEYPLRAPTLSPSKGVVLQDLLLNVITAQCSSAKLGSSSGKKEISMEFLTRLVRALFKVNAINNAVNDTPDDGGPQARTKQIVREWIKTNQDSRGFAISVVMEWRQTLLDLNKFVIYNVAIGDDATIDIIKKNSRWQVEGGKWLKSASALEALNVLRRHLNILDPKVTEDLAPKLHLLGLRSVADTVRQWVNEAIIPDRHYRPPPKKGSDKVARNESKERAKAEEFDLTSPLTRIGPMTVANLFGAWLFKGAEKEGTDFKEGRMVALESLMKLMCARTFTHVDVSVERRILKLVRKALLEEDKGALLIILRVMGDLFLSEIPGVCGLVAPFLSLSEQLLPGVGESTIFLGNQSKTALMQALCCIVTLLGKFGHLKSGPEDDAVLLSSFGTRLGDIFIHFMDGATSNEDGCDWVRTCASGLFFLMTEELWKQEGGAEIDDFNIRHWVNTLCEWCNNASDNVAFASMSCLHDLSQLYPHLGGDDLDLHHTLILNLCGSTWQMIRNVYNTAHEELTKAHLGQQQKGKAGSGRNIRGGGGVGGGGKPKVREEKVIETKNGQILEVDTATFVSPRLSKRIVCALNCISDWVMYNPTQFLLHEDACMKFFDVLEAAAMGKLPVTQVASKEGAFGEGGESGFYQATNRLPRMLLQLRMDQHLEKKGNVVVPVFPEISEAAEDIITHLLNLLNREEDYKNVDLSHPGRFDLQVDENDPSQGEKDTSVFFSYLDSMLISLVHNSKEGEGVVVVRDSSGAYTWRSTVETIGRAQVEPTLLKSIIRRRSTNKSYNKSLYEADLRGSADDHSEHKGPAWYKNSSSSFIIGSASMRGTSPSSCYIYIDGSEGKMGSSSDRGVSLDLVDEHDEEIVFETRQTSTSGNKEDGGEGQFSMEGLSIGDRPESARTLGSSVSTIPPPPPAKGGGMLEKSLSGIPPQGPPPGGDGLVRNVSERSIPPPPPFPLSTGLIGDGAERSGSETSSRSSGSGCTSVRFGDGVKDSDGDGEQAALDRKALLLARVNSRGKAKKSSMAGTFFEDFDLKSDPLKDALSTMEVFEVDDPTLLGNKFAIEKEFSGDLSTGSAGDSARIRPVESVLRILNDDVVSKLLQKFLKKEVALESYNFYVEVNEFKAGSAGVTGQSIFDKYVKEGSDEQINIPSGMMTEIKKCLEEGGGVFGSETFDAAVNEVVTMLARDKLPRFLNSDGVVERKDLYERCVKLAMRVEDGEKKAEGKMGGGGSPKRGEKKVPMVARQDAESMLSAGIDDALLGNVTRLFASQIGLLQPYDNDLFKVLRVTKDDDKKFKTFVRNLQHLDITRSRETVKIGVLYVGNGQTNQKEVLANQKGSVMYEEFIGGLGSLVDLKTHKGFTGKLDTKYYSNGRYLTYHSTSTTETAFHISTQMPTALNDPQQVKKKRHISNDHVQIVWSDSDRDYLPCTLTSEFNDVIISLYPLKRGNRSDLLRCKITAKEGIPYFGPLTDGMIIRAGVAPKLVRLTAINANRVVREAQGEEMNRPHVERRKIIKQLVDVYGEDYKGGEVFESLCRIVR